MKHDIWLYHGYVTAMWLVMCQTPECEDVEVMTFAFQSHSRKMGRQVHEEEVTVKSLNVTQDIILQENKRSHFPCLSPYYYPTMGRNMIK